MERNFGKILLIFLFILGSSLAFSLADDSICNRKSCSSKIFEDPACWDCGYIPDYNTSQVIIRNSFVQISSQINLYSLLLKNSSIEIRREGILSSDGIFLNNRSSIRTFQNASLGSDSTRTFVFVDDGELHGRGVNLNVSVKKDGRLKAYNVSLTHSRVINNNYMILKGQCRFNMSVLENLGKLEIGQEDDVVGSAISGPMLLISTSSLYFFGEIETKHVSYHINGDSSSMYIDGAVIMNGIGTFEYSGIQLKIATGLLTLGSTFKSVWSSPRLNGPGTLSFMDDHIATFRSNLNGNNLPIMASSTLFRFETQGSISTPWFIGTNVTVWAKEKAWISSDLMDIRTLTVSKGSLSLEATPDSSNFNVNGTLYVLGKDERVEFNAPNVLLDCDFYGDGEIISSSTTTLTLSPRPFFWNIPKISSKGNTVFTQQSNDGTISMSQIMGPSRPLIVKALISLSVHPAIWNQSFVIVEHSDSSNLLKWEVTGDFTCFSGVVSFSNDSVIFYYGSPTFFPTISPSGFLYGSGILPVSWGIDSSGPQCMNYTVAQYKLMTVDDDNNNKVLKTSKEASSFKISTSTLSGCRTNRIWVEMTMMNIQNKYPNISFSSDDLNYFPTNVFNKYIPKGSIITDTTSSTTGFNITWDYSSNDKPPCLIDFKTIIFSLSNQTGIMQNFSSSTSMGSTFITTVSPCTRISITSKMKFQVRDFDFTSFEVYSASTSPVVSNFYPNLQKVIVPTIKTNQNSQNSSTFDAVLSWDNQPLRCRCDPKHQSGSYWRANYYSSNESVISVDTNGGDGTILLKNLEPDSGIHLNLSAVCIYAISKQSVEYQTKIREFVLTIPSLPPSSTIPTSSSNDDHKEPSNLIGRKGWVATLIFGFLVVLFLGAAAFVFIRRWRRKKMQKEELESLFSEDY